MSRNIIQTVQQQAEIALTYLLTLVDGTQHWLIPVDALNGVVMDDPTDRGTMTGKLYDGGTVEVAISDIFMVEEKPYRVTRWNGQTNKSQRCSEGEVERIIERATDPETGEVGGNIRRIEDTRDPNNGVDKRKNSWW